jgi:hypothetical protein
MIALVSIRFQLTISMFNFFLPCFVFYSIRCYFSCEFLCYSNRVPVLFVATVMFVATFGDIVIQKVGFICVINILDIPL